MHANYEQAWQKLKGALGDTDVPKAEYAEALEEMISELEMDLEAVKEELKAEGD